MADLFEIGKSGVQSYRRALGVTGQNIANANTEGYNRRDAQLAEVSATQGDILSVSDQAGLGVRVENIRRAFDDLIVAKTNTANSSFENARAANEKLQLVERILLPGDYSISSYLHNFFDGLNAVHQAPTDLGARQLVIEYGELLADGVVSLANGLANLKNELRTEATSVAEMVNVTVSGLLEVQKKLISSGGSGAASNSLLDQRDLLIQELSGYVGISTLYGERGAVKISLGPNNGKEKLLDLFDTQQLVLDESKSQLGYALLKGSAVSATTQVTNGYLAGLSKASDAIDETLKQLDNLTQKLIQDFNDIHRNGLTLNEDQGRDLFSVGTHDIFIEPNNTHKFDVFVSNGKLSVTRELVYVEKLASFVDISNGDTFDLLNNQITIDQGVLQFSDVPYDGDTIYLEPLDNISKSLKFVIEHPQDIAASSSFEVNNNLDNSGEGNLYATKKPAGKSANLVEISDIFNNDLNPVAAQSFRSNVTASTIPPKVHEIEFLVTEKQASARFVLSESEIALLPSQTLSFDGIDFILSGENQANWNNLEELVDGLNEGSIRGNDNASLSELGLIASTNGSTLSFTQKRSETQQFVSVELGGVTAKFGSPPASEGNVYVFSRDGRQIAGSALSDTQIQEFISSNYGFFEDAEYRADYLNRNLLGSSVKANGVDLSYQFTLPASGNRSSNISQSYFSESGISSSLNRHGFDIWIGETTTDAAKQVISIDPGLMATDVQNSIDAVLSKFGILASVNNKVKASLSSGLQYPSTVNFGLKNKDGTYSDINVSLLSNDLTELVNKINLVSGKTGVVAQMSNASSAFTLEHVSGDEIVFSDFEFNGLVANENEFLYLEKLSSDGAIIQDASVRLYSGKSLRVSGDVDLHSSSRFAASIAPYASQEIPELTDARASKHSTFITENLSLGGDTSSVNFDFASDLFSDSTNDFAASAYIADAKIAFEINATVIEADIAKLSDKSSRGIATDIVKQYRSSKEINLLTEIEFSGTALNLKEAIEFEFEGQKYTVGVEFPNGDVSRLAEAEIIGDGNFAKRFNTSLLPQEDGYTLVIGALDGVPTAEIMHFSNLNASANVTQKLTGPEAEIILSGTSPTEEEFTDLDEFRTNFATTTRAAASDFGLELYDLKGDYIETRSSLTSSVKSHIKLKNLPAEELIVLFDNASTSNFSVKHSSSSILEPENRDLIVKSIDSELGIVEILDAATRQSLATRVMDVDGRFSALGFDFELGGTTVTGDEFKVQHTAGGDANSDNLLNLLALSVYNSETGSGEFNQIFKQMVTDLGMEVKSSQITRDAADNAKQSILELKDEFSGVNLDTEAANLMEQQQAYQALARVLSTARDLLNTLMEVI
ncbi:flagellar hook-associated protein FlgK [Rhodobacteraceae bacterium HIMB11]|nr:flagellar hook-associated protein FlgK [Rhodobacteraceae bacterium HIMB11]